MSATTKMKISSGTRVLFNFHIMINLAQSLYWRVLIEPESHCDMQNV